MYRKSIVAILLCCCMAFGLRAQERELVILHTNDTHSQIEPFTYKGDTNVGGFLRREAYIREVREKHPNVLLFDAGDFSQGTPYFNIFEGYTEVKLMNAMRYDAVTLGNHEFDNGSAALAKRLKTAKFPVVCANYQFENKALAKRVKPHVIVERNGLKIGIFGLVTELEHLVAPSVAKELTYLDPVAAAAREVAALRAAGCDLIVCLSHLGIDENTTNDRLVAEKVPGIDIIIGGHSHKKLAEPIILINTHIYQLDSKGKEVGQITIHY